jgi:hypothetical protein
MLFRRVPLLAASVAASVTLVTLADEPAIVLELPAPVATTEETPATTKPSRPATQPASASTLQRQFADLAHADGAVRDRAFAGLLCLTRDDLPALRRVVEQARPVAPSQAAALRDLVAHVYLSDEPYAGEPRAGFLGLLIPTLDSVDVRRAEQPEVFEITDNAQNGGIRALPSTGVPIEYRIPGFCAFRALREGDIVLGIVKPTLRRLRDWSELSMSVRSFRAGETLTLEVVRQGVVTTVPVTLDARPLVPAESIWQDEILPAREAAAQAYWNEHFARLVDERSADAAK